MNERMILPFGKMMSARHTASVFLLMIICIITGTFLRVSLLFIYPVIAIIFAGFYKFRITAAVMILFSLALLSFFLSMYPHLFLKYKMLSLFYMVPFLLLLFSDPVAEKNTGTSQLGIFMSCLSIVAAINNLIGFIQVLINPASDDSFRGLYSQYSISLNGLMLINAILFFYYFILFLESKKLSYFLLFVFFGFSANLGFYGAGLIVCMIALILTFLRFHPISMLRTTAIASVSLAVIYLSLLTFKPFVLDYNLANIKKLIALDVQKGPRKVISFYNYGISYPKNFKDFVFGSGPGTYVSRSAFMVGSPTYFQALPFIKDDEQPYYFRNYAYTLWNDKNTIKELYLDGFRNQPFSSVLAIMGEYGILFFVAFCLFFIYYFRKVRNLYHFARDIPGSFESYRLFKFLMILLALLLLIDNYLEYPEIILVIVPAIKFAHADLLDKLHHHPTVS